MKQASYRIPDFYVYSTFSDYSIIINYNIESGQSDKVFEVRGLTKEVLDFTFLEQSQVLDFVKIKIFLDQKYSFTGSNLKIYYKHIQSFFQTGRS